jgi:endo-1,3-1,4-beta-glycanase ExoK
MADAIVCCAAASNSGTLEREKGPDAQFSLSAGEPAFISNQIRGGVEVAMIAAPMPLALMKRLPTLRLPSRGSPVRLSVSFVLLLLGGAGFLPGASSAGEASGQSFRDDFETFDRSRWYVSDGWANGEHQNCTWSKDQLELSEGVLTLSFEKRQTKDRGYACAEIQTYTRFGYGTYEARFKTDTGSGINAAFFTYIGPSDGQPHDEIDFEVLTRDPSRVSVNTYVDGKPRNGSEVEVGGGADSAFNDYAFVWEEDRLRWYVNGTLVHEAAGPAELPSHPQKIFFSLWGSDTLDDWMGTFEDPGRPLTMEVDWVAFTAQGDECQFPESVVCKAQ